VISVFDAWISEKISIVHDAISFLNMAIIVESFHVSITICFPDRFALMDLSEDCIFLPGSSGYIVGSIRLSCVCLFSVPISSFVRALDAYCCRFRVVTVLSDSTINVMKDPAVDICNVGGQRREPRERMTELQSRISACRRQQNNASAGSTPQAGKTARMATHDGPELQLPDTSALQYRDLWPPFPYPCNQNLTSVPPVPPPIVPGTSLTIQS
jgi:hypothetical protein